MALFIRLPSPAFLKRDYIKSVLIIIKSLSSDTAPTDTSPSRHSSYYNDEFDAEAFAQYFDVISPDSLVIIRPYSNDDDDRLLETIKPKFIVMYQPDIGFIRRVEVLLMIS